PTLAFAIIWGDESIPQTRAPCVAISAVRRPVPQPRSRTRSSGREASRSSRALPCSVTKPNELSYVPASHRMRRRYRLVLQIGILCLTYREPNAPRRAGSRRGWWLKSFPGQDEPRRRAAHLGGGSLPGTAMVGVLLSRAGQAAKRSL